MIRVLFDVEFSPYHNMYLPVVYCEEEKTKNGKVIGWKFKCPFCKQWHSHSPEEGPRESHCHNQKSNEIFAKGYYLKLKE